MTGQEISIRFYPGGGKVSGWKGISLLEAAALAGVIVDTPCGGAGTCGKCRVRFRENAPEPHAVELRLLDADAIADGWRLGCQVHIDADAEIEVPAESVLCGYHQIQTDSNTTNDRSMDVDIRKYYLTLTPPTLNDGVPDLLRIERAVQTQVGGNQESSLTLEAPAGVLQVLGDDLRASKFSGTVTLRGSTLVHFEPDNTVDAAYGVAFDIGTTTLVGVLMHLVSGKEIGVASALNPQTAYGDDVLSRIAFASKDKPSLTKIRSCLLEQLQKMVQQLCEQAGISAQHIYTVSVAGNTTMQHLVLGCNPASLGMVPFVPVYGRSVVLPAEEFTLGIYPYAQAYVFPVIGGFVGGDTVSGMLATDLVALDNPVLMLDIGTNGELVLVHNENILAASTAAGPAFEGSRISCGMRATDGAIERVSLSGDLELGVIGSGTPRGICGSGLIDICAQLLNAGALTPDGRLLIGNDLSESVPAGLRHRMRLGRENEPECVLYEDSNRTLRFTQKDVREVQLGVGAIRAGIVLLLKQAGLVAGDLQQIMIAGGFGSFIRRDNAQRIGLIPGEVSHEKIRFVGNVALSGAKWTVVSEKARRTAEHLALTAKHVQLSQDPDFALEFAMAMQFPEKG